MTTVPCVLWTAKGFERTLLQELQSLEITNLTIPSYRQVHANLTRAQLQLIGKHSYLLERVTHIIGEASSLDEVSHIVDKDFSAHPSKLELSYCKVDNAVPVKWTPTQFSRSVTTTGARAGYAITPQSKNKLRIERQLVLSVEDSSRKPSIASNAMWSAFEEPPKTDHQPVVPVDLSRLIPFHIRAGFLLNSNFYKHVRSSKHHGERKDQAFHIFDPLANHGEMLDCLNTINKNNPIVRSSDLDFLFPTQDSTDESQDFNYESDQIPDKNNLFMSNLNLKYSGYCFRGGLSERLTQIVNCAVRSSPIKRFGKFSANESNHLIAFAQRVTKPDDISIARDFKQRFKKERSLFKTVDVLWESGPVKFGPAGEAVEQYHVSRAL